MITENQKLHTRFLSPSDLLKQDNSYDKEKVEKPKGGGKDPSVSGCRTDLMGIVL
jgi:hypothetical protein